MCAGDLGGVQERKNRVISVSERCLRRGSPAGVSSFICAVPVGLDFSGGSVGESLPAKAGDAGSVPGAGRSPGEGNGNPLQYSCLENSMDRGAW